MHFCTVLPHRREVLSHSLYHLEHRHALNQTAPHFREVLQSTEIHTGPHHMAASTQPLAGVVFQNTTSTELDGVWPLPYTGKTQLTAPQNTKTFSAGVPIMHQSRNSPAPQILTLCHIVTRSPRLGLLVRSPPASPLARSTFLGTHVNNLLADDAQLLKVAGSGNVWALGRLTPVILTTCHRRRRSIDVAVFLGLKES